MNSDRQYERTMELWRSYSIATSLELAAHLENFAILFSYNSGKIENREITYRIFQSESRSQHPPNAVSSLFPA